MLARPQNHDLDAGPQKTPPGAERFCAATGAVTPVGDMIRFVIAPDGSAIPDLKRRLPGRGVWITATRSALQRAIARKAFARSFKRDVRVAGDLVSMTERLLERSALEALGIAHKAARVAIGFAKAEAAITQNDAVALLHAVDGAPDGARKLDAVLHRDRDNGKQIAVISELTSAQLDLALGRSNVIHAALLAGPESQAFLARALRLQRFRTDGNAGLTDRAGKPQKWNRNG
jgi:uncharacterized protein